MAIEQERLQSLHLSNGKPDAKSVNQAESRALMHERKDASKPDAAVCVPIGACSVLTPGIPRGCDVRRHPNLGLSASAAAASIVLIDCPGIIRRRIARGESLSQRLVDIGRRFRRGRLLRRSLPGALFALRRIFLLLPVQRAAPFVATVFGSAGALISSASVPAHHVARNSRHSGWRSNSRST